MTEQDTPVESVDAFADRVQSAALGWIDLMSIHLGSQLGWYRALAQAGPLDADELAAATGTHPRYAREWLEQQAATGLLRVAEPGDAPGPARFVLPPAAAEVLTDGTSLSYLEPLARMFASSGARMEDLIDAYRTGGGVSWERLGRHARQSQADMNRPWYEQELAGAMATHAPVHDMLSRPGARIADVGMGEGWSSIALATAFPGLRVEGFDVDHESVVAARANAERAGVADRVAFHEEDAARLPEFGPFDGVFAFECLHDMPHPVEVLAAARGAVAPGGHVVIMDEASAEWFAPDADDTERLLYGFSLFICLPDGMSHQPSAGTGTVFRQHTLRDYARAAGWSDARVIVPEFGMWRFYEIV
ncbi:class I SAM-dependent methyltransferase [Microbacterium hominis]|uniref:Methyltransferase domain-containing protein n=1 Tax=Microbacterium hominis TaxID=162426 RepID=A0A7D4UAF3_9MICO|nr:class I SAM-dependent methyltransferase [Microbacterium hominis]QKJ18403.1 methyltransferase domain-containing protein [Microbacterium hominis]